MFVCLRRLPPCAASGNTRSTLSVTPSWFTMPRGASCGATSDCVNCWAANARLWSVGVLLSFFLSKTRSEEHTSELQSRLHLVCGLLLEKEKSQAPSRQDATDYELSPDSH